MMIVALTTMKAVAQVVDERSVEFLVERLHQQEQRALQNVDDESGREVRNGEAEMDENRGFDSCEQSRHSPDGV